MANGDAAGKYGVIWDLDGVLIDTGEYHRRSWNDLGEREGFVMSDELFKSTFGMQNYQIIPMLFARSLSEEEVGQLGERKEERYRELISGELKILAGVRELLEGLREAGFRMAIGSSTPRKNLEFMLEHLPVGEYFDEYVCGEDVRRGKPAPDTFLKATEKLGLEADKCVVIEDAPAGVKAGKSAGMKVIGVTNTVRAEELVMADLVTDSLAKISAGDIFKLLRG